MRKNYRKRKKERKKMLYLSLSINRFDPNSNYTRVNHEFIFLARPGNPFGMYNLHTLISFLKILQF